MSPSIGNQDRAAYQQRLAEIQARQAAERQAAIARAAAAQAQAQTQQNQQAAAAHPNIPVEAGELEVTAEEVTSFSEDAFVEQAEGLTGVSRDQLAAFYAEASADGEFSAADFDQGLSEAASVNVSVGSEADPQMVQEIQTSLLQAGLLQPDSYQSGVYDAATEAAVIQFQTDNQLLVDGIVGTETRDMIQAMADTREAESQDRLQDARAELAGAGIDTGPAEVDDRLQDPAVRQELAGAGIVTGPSEAEVEDARQTINSYALDLDRNGGPYTEQSIAQVNHALSVLEAAGDEEGVAEAARVLQVMADETVGPDAAFAREFSDAGTDAGAHAHFNELDAEVQSGQRPPSDPEYVEALNTTLRGIGTGLTEDQTAAFAQRLEATGQPERAQFLATLTTDAFTDRGREAAFAILTGDPADAPHRFRELLQGGGEISDAGFEALATQIPAMFEGTEQAEEMAQLARVADTIRHASPEVQGQLRRLFDQDNTQAEMAHALREATSHTDLNAIREALAYETSYRHSGTDAVQQGLAAAYEHLNTAVPSGANGPFDVGAIAEATQAAYDETYERVSQEITEQAALNGSLF